MENDLIKTKLRKVDVPILVSYMSAPIFVPVSKRVNRDEAVFRRIEIFSTKNMKIKAKVPLLDLSVDFPIWASALKELSESEKIDKKNPKVRISENEFLKKLGISKNNINLKNKKNIDRRLELMMSAIITIEIYSDTEEFLEKSYINLFTTAKWSREDGYFEFTFNPDIYGAYSDFMWKSIDMDYYRSIKTEYAKALFLYYESHSDFIIPIERSTLINRLNISDYSRANNINQKLKEAHNLLSEIGFLKKFEIEKSKENKKVYYKVQKRKKKERKTIESAMF